MNSALRYLLKRNFINGFNKFIKSPAKVILTLLFIISMGFSIFARRSSGEALFKDTENLYAIIFGYFSLIYLISVRNGVENGNSAFRMADINLLFVSPINQKQIFIYGLIKSLFASIIGGIFLIYQFNLFSMYGVNTIEFIFIFISFVLFSFILQFVFFFVYSFVSNNEKHTKIAKGLFYLPFVIIAAYSVLLYLNTKDLILSLVTASTNNLVYFIPVIGWIVGMIKFFLLGEYLKSLAVLALNLIAFVILYYIMARRNTEFYEDVLASAANNEKLRAAQKSGKRATRYKTGNTKGSEVKIKGSGSKVYFSVNKILNKRTNVLIIPRKSLVIIGFTLIMSFIFTDNHNAYYPTIMSIYMALFLFMNGRFDEHLKKNYIYLIPDKPFIKLVNLMLSELYVFLVESVILYIILYFVLHFPLIHVFYYTAIRMSACLVIIAVSLLVKRVVGQEGVLSRFSLLFGGMAALAIPGIAGIIINIYSKSFLIPTASICLVAIVEASIMIFGSRNLLKYVNY